MVGLVSRKKIEWVSYNYELSLHAKDRIKERLNTNKTIRELIINSPLSWGLDKNILIIAFNLYEYIAVSTDTGKPIVVTFVDLRQHKKGITVIDLFIQYSTREQR